jgi:phosphopantothenate synthetase
MAGEKNFNIKNGLSVGGVEVITSAGALTGAAIIESIDDRVNGLLQAGTGVSLSYDDAAGTLTINGQQGDITGVNAGAGLTGTATSGDATLNIGAGTGITVNADDIAVNMTAFDTDNLSEGSSNLYFTDERVDDRVGALIVGGTGITATYNDSAGTLTLTSEVGDITSVVAGSGLSGGGVTGDVTLTLDTGAVFQEAVADTVGAMVTSNTESGITVAYVDADNTLDFTISTLNQDTTGNAATATALETSRTISGTSFDGTSNVTLNTSAITENTNLYYTDERVDDRVSSLIVGGTGITSTYDDSAGTLTLTSEVGDITSVVAGDGLSGGGTAGDVTLSVGVDDSSIETDSDVLRVKALGITDAMLAGSISAAKLAGSIPNSALSNSAITVNGTSTALGTSVTLDTSDLSENGNLFHTSERVMDTTAAFLTAGANITLTHDDAGNTLTIAATEDNLSNNDTDDLTEGSSNQYFTTARARTSVSASGDLAYNSTTGVFSFTNDAGDIESVVAGDGLTGGGTAGDVTLNVNVDDSSIETNSDTVRVKALGITDAMLAGSISNAKLANSSITVNGNATALGSTVTLDTSDLSEVTNLFHTTERVQDVVGTMATAGTNITLAYDDTAGTLTINSSGKTQEEIEDIVNGLVVGGTNITSTYDDTAGTLTLAGLSDANIRGLVSAGGDLSYNSSTGAFSFTERTDAEVRGLISVTDTAGDGALSYNSSNGVLTYAGVTDAQIRGKVSVTDNGGDGSLSYSSASGVISYTGPSASETRAHLSAGTGVAFSGGAFSIGQAVATNSNVTFNNATVDGNLTVNGTTTSINTETLTVDDNIFVLNNNVTGTPTEDAGMEIERGTSANVSLLWDESEDEWTFGAFNVKASSFEGSLTGNAATASSAAQLTTARTIALGGDLSGSASFDGTGNISITAVVADDSHNHTIANVDGLQTSLNTKYASGSNIVAGTLTTSNASNSGGYVRNMYQSTSAPVSGDGAVGDLWVLYS